MRHIVDRDISDINSVAPEKTGRDFDNVSPLEIFREVSAAGPEDMAALDELDRNIGPLPSEPFQAASAIRAHLIKEGFKYDGNTFQLQDILKQRKGNCLGLACLFGGILERRGFHPEYELLSGIMGSDYKEEVKLFEEFDHCNYFNFDKPKLPSVEEDFKPFCFVAAEHPVLLFGDKRFETTDLNKLPVLLSGDKRFEATTDLGLELDVENSQPLVAKSERAVKMTYAELASSVLWSRAGDELDHSKSNYVSNYVKVRELLDESIRHWPNNRGPYMALRRLAEKFFDDEQEGLARKKYLAFGGDDSLFLFNQYEITNDPLYLDKVLRRYHSHIPAYFYKKVYRETNFKDAKFAFAVTAQCLARSQMFDLGQFYIEFNSLFAELYGEETAERYICSAAENSQDHFNYNIALYRLTGDEQYIKKIEQENLITTPKEEFYFYDALSYVVAGGIPDSYRKRYAAFLKQYGNRRTFKELVAKNDIQLAGQWYDS